MKASLAYYSGKPIMTDAEFDASIIQLRKDDPNNPFLKHVMGVPIPGTLKVKHKILMGSLSNANNEQEFTKWIPDDQPGICLSHKLDGSSVELIYEKGVFVQAITRGDGEIGEDVTRNVILSPHVPLKIDPSIVSVRCECLIHIDDWLKYFKGDANPRNSAAGTLRRHDGRNAEHLRFYAFDALVDTTEQNMKTEFGVLDVLSRWFSIPLYMISSSPTQLVSYCRLEENYRNQLPYEIDGIVAKINDRTKSEEMGSKDGRPKGQIAIKFKPRGGETVLRDITWQVGHTGALTPVGEVDPVVVGGTTIKRVTLCNMDEIERLNICIGDMVEVIRAGDVIPKLSRRVRKGDGRKLVFAPLECPECGSKTKKDGARLFCTNDECKGQALSRVMTWIKKRNILNLGVGIIKAAGIQCIYDLYDMREYEWANVKIKNGVLGEKRAKKIMDSLEKSKSVSLPEFLGSIGIKGVGRSLATDLCNWLGDCPNFGNELILSDIFMLKDNLVARCEGFGETRARDFCKYLMEYRQEIEDSASFLCFENQLDTQDRKGIFDGDIICFTGKSPKTRPEMTALAESAGASISSSVGPNTTILVIADMESTSSKAIKARKLEIVFMSPEDFLSQVEDKCV